MKHVNIIFKNDFNKLSTVHLLFKGGLKVLDMQYGFLSKIMPLRSLQDLTLSIDAVYNKKGYDVVYSLRWWLDILKAIFYMSKDNNFKNFKLLCHFPMSNLLSYVEKINFKRTSSEIWLESESCWKPRIIDYENTTNPRDALGSVNVKKISSIVIDLT